MAQKNRPDPAMAAPAIALKTPPAQLEPAGEGLPSRRGQLWAWLAYALALLLAPQIFSSGLGVALLSQIGFTIIILLSYNLLLGQGGMLSFGHAVYVGLGAFVAIHALNMAGSGALALPVGLVPLAGGLGGAFFAVVFGYLSTRRGGTTFAMISLGIGELVAAASLLFPGFFGGEGGISADRVVGTPVLGVSFGPSIEVYYLIALYCLVCTALMFAFTQTPLGRLLNAVRDNAERVAFIGYNPQRVRYLGFIIAGFFAGIGGGLMVLHFEAVSAIDSFSAVRSGAYLLFVFVGGSTVFFGPIIGAVLMVLATVFLAQLTQAWPLYLGVLFLLMVMFAPGGLAGIAMANLRLVRAGRWRPLVLPYLAVVVALLLLSVPLAALVEMVYHLQHQAVMGDALLFFGVALNVATALHWWAALLWLLLAAGLFGLVLKWFAQVWQNQQTEPMPPSGGGAL